MTHGEMHMNFLMRSVPFFYFCLRVLVCAAISWPVYAQTSSSSSPTAPAVEVSNIELPTPLLEPERPGRSEKVDPSSEQPLTVPEVTSGPEEVTSLKPVTEAPVAELETAGSTNDYWIVSSRRAVQNMHTKDSGPWLLDVYHAHQGSACQPSNTFDLSTKLIPGVPVCIITHGSFVTWQSHCQQAEQAFRYFRWGTGNQPLQFIFFSWPSDGPYTRIPQVDVAVRGKRADFNGFHLATLLSHIPETCPVTMIGHSHGTRVTLAAMQLAAGGTIQGYAFTGSVGAQRRMRAILAAGAMDHTWLNPGEQYGLALNRLECLLNLQNQNDLPLALYPLSRPFARRPIARAGITSGDMATLGYNAQKIRQVDVTNRIGSAHYWPDYYTDAQVLAAIAPYLVSF